VVLAAQSCAFDNGRPIHNTMASLPIGTLLVNSTGFGRVLDLPQLARTIRAACLERASSMRGVAEKVTAPSGITERGPWSTARETPRRRDRERRWREAHAAELREFQGEWAVVEGEELVAHGLNPGDVVAAARAKGVKVPYVFFIEPLQNGVLRFGL
jgi:hypothetical protein